MIAENANSSFPLSVVSPHAKIHPGVQIEAFSTIYGDVEIGRGSYIGSNVTIYDGVRIGENCRILSGTVISADTAQLEYWTNDDSTAQIKPGVRIGDSVHIEPSATLHGGITIGSDCWIGSGATIHDGARIGNHCRIFPGAIISAIPQDMKFKGEKTTVEIGDYTTIRECATLNRGTNYNSKTTIGKHVLIMAYVHIAHDCIIGDHVIIANAVNMAGHVEISDYAVIGGASAIHQFVKIGRHVMLSGGSLVGKDVPPYVKGARTPLQYAGVNSIGLRRRGFSNDRIHHIQDIYRHLFLPGMNTTQALDYIEAHLPATEERDEIITFVRNTTRGIIPGYKAKSQSHTK